MVTEEEGLKDLELYFDLALKLFDYPFGEKYQHWKDVLGILRLCSVRKIDNEVIGKCHYLPQR